MPLRARIRRRPATARSLDKLIDYAALPSLRCYVLPEQTAIAATLFHREPGGVWIDSAHTDGAVVLPGLDLTLPLAELYRGLTFSTLAPRGAP